MVDREVIEVGGAAGTLRVLCWSESGARDTGRPIALLLHGFPDAPDTWEPMARRLAADGWRVAAPYLRGYAPSDLASDYSHHVGALMDDALRVVDALGTTDRDVVIGHDWGAIIAGVLASLPDNPFRKAADVGADPGVLPDPRAGRAAVVARPAARATSAQLVHGVLPAAQAPERSARQVIPFLWRRWSVRRDVDSPPCTTRRAPDRWTAAISYYRCAARDKTVPARYRAYQDRFGSHPRSRCSTCTATVTAHSVPVSPTVPAWSSRKAARSTVADAGHFLQFDKPEEDHREDHRERSATPAECALDPAFSAVAADSVGRMDDRPISVLEVSAIRR